MVFPTQDVFANCTPELDGDDVHDSSSGSRVPHDPFITKSVKFSGGGHWHRTANVLSEVRLSQSQALQACSHAAMQPPISSIRACLFLTFFLARPGQTPDPILL